MSDTVPARQAQSAQDVSDNELRALLRKTFSPTALPEHIVRLSSIPRTATGKVLRARLGEQLKIALHETPN